MAAVIERADTLETAMRKINAEIDQRRTYGVRRDVLPSRVNVSTCSWSNGAASWFCGSPQKELTCQGGSKLKELERRVRSFESECRQDDEALRAFWDFARAAQLENAPCKRRIAEGQCLDANEIAIVGVKRSTLQALQDSFNSLPLYAGSFEARARGVFSLKGIEVPPGIARQRLDDLDPQAIRALVEKAVEETEE